MASTAYLFYGFIEGADDHWEEAYARHWEDFASASTFELRTHVVFGTYGPSRRFLAESTVTFFTGASHAFPLEDADGSSPLSVSGLYLRACEGRMRDQAHALGLDLGKQMPRWWLVSYAETDTARREHGQS